MKSPWSYVILVGVLVERCSSSLNLFTASENSVRHCEDHVKSQFFGDWLKGVKDRSSDICFIMRSRRSLWRVLAQKYSAPRKLTKTYISHWTNPYSWTPNYIWIIILNSSPESGVVLQLLIGASYLCVTNYLFCSTSVIVVYVHMYFEPDI